MSSGKLPRSAMPIKKQNIFSYSPQSSVYQYRHPWSPVQAASVWRFIGHYWWERQGTMTQELSFQFPAYLCNTVGLSNIEVRRGWDIGVEKHGRKPFRVRIANRRNDWSEVSEAPGSEWKYKRSFWEQLVKNLCCKWNPKLNSFLSDKEWHRQFP